MSKTILCADDSATMQTVAEITFRATEYSYAGARSADEALSKARADKPALVLVDAVMPGKSGYDLCRELKADPALAGVPVMLMCGNSESYDDGKGAEAGVDAHVTKPWDTQQMLDKVNELLTRVGSEGVAKSGSAAAAAPPAAAAPKPAAAAPPAPAAPPASAARTATIMGMPTIKMPGLGGAPAAPVVPKVVAPPVAPKPVAPPVVAAPKPPAAPPAPVAKPAPVVAPAPAPAAPAPVAARSAAAPASSRSPMVGGLPSKRPFAIPVTALQAAREVGLDPDGPEMAALMKLSEGIVERIVWEIVPQLAEAIIKENLDKVGKTG